MSVANLAKHLQQFFTGRLHGQLGASHHTVASYRDTFRLLLKFATKQYRRQASDLRVEDLDAKLVSTFLKHLEHDRHNSARTRNNRLSAIHAFFGYVSVNEPALANHCQRVLAIPPKRFERGPVQFLSEEETSALLKAPDTRTWLGRRDQLLLQMALQTGLRNSELIRLCRQDVELGTGAHIKCLGKGRKYGKVVVMERCLGKTLQRQRIVQYELSITRGGRESEYHRRLDETEGCLSGVDGLWLMPAFSSPSWPRHRDGRFGDFRGRGKEQSLPWGHLLPTKPSRFRA